MKTNIVVVISWVLVTNVVKLGTTTYAPLQLGVVEQKDRMLYHAVSNRVMMVEFEGRKHEVILGTKPVKSWIEEVPVNPWQVGVTPASFP